MFYEIIKIFCIINHFYNELFFYFARIKNAKNQLFLFDWIQFDGEKWYIYHIEAENIKLKIW